MFNQGISGLLFKDLCNIDRLEKPTGKSLKSALADGSLVVRGARWMTPNPSTPCITPLSRGSILWIPQHSTERVDPSRWLGRH